MQSIYVWVALSLAGGASCTPLREPGRVHFQRLRGLQSHVGDKQSVKEDVSFGAGEFGLANSAERMLSDSTSGNQDPRIPTTKSARPEGDNASNKPTPNRTETEVLTERGERAQRGWESPLKIRRRKREAKQRRAPEEKQDDEHTEPATRGPSMGIRNYVRRLVTYATTLGRGKEEGQRNRYVVPTSLSEGDVEDSGSSARTGGDASAIQHPREKGPRGATSTLEGTMNRLGYSAAAQAAEASGKSARGGEVPVDALKKAEGPRRGGEDHRQEIGTTTNTLKGHLKSCASCDISDSFDENSQRVVVLHKDDSKVQTGTAAAAAAAKSADRVGEAGHTADSSEDEEEGVAAVSALTREERDTEARRQTRHTVKTILKSGVSTMYIIEPTKDGAKGEGRKEVQDNDADGGPDRGKHKLQTNSQNYAGEDEKHSGTLSTRAEGLHKDEKPYHPRTRRRETAVPRGGAEAGPHHSGKGEDTYGADHRTDDRVFNHIKASDLERQLDSLMQAVFERGHTLVFTVESPTDEESGLEIFVPEARESKRPTREETHTVACSVEACSEDSGMAQNHAGGLLGLKTLAPQHPRRTLGSEPRKDHLNERSERFRWTAGDNPQKDHSNEQGRSERSSEQSLLVGDTAQQRTRQGIIGEGLPTLLSSSASSAPTYHSQSTDPRAPFPFPPCPAQSYHQPQASPAVIGRPTSPFAAPQRRRPLVTVQLGVARAGYIETPVAHRVPPLAVGNDE